MVIIIYAPVAVQESDQRRRDAALVQRRRTPLGERRVRGRGGVRRPEVALRLHHDHHAQPLEYPGGVCITGGILGHVVVVDDRPEGQACVVCEGVWPGAGEGSEETVVNEHHQGSHRQKRDIIINAHRPPPRARAAR